MRAIITGGGTGGHIYPALAIADELRRRVDNMEILYVGSKGMESRIVPEAGYAFTAIDVSGIDRSSMLKASRIDHFYYYYQRNSNSEQSPFHTTKIYIQSQSHSCTGCQNMNTHVAFPG
jgi:UDP-N-acetylglucosamine:LPS N-acetylglucosamine transferase